MRACSGSGGNPARTRRPMGWCMGGWAAVDEGRQMGWWMGGWALVDECHQMGWWMGGWAAVDEGRQMGWCVRKHVDGRPRGQKYVVKVCGQSKGVWSRGAWSLVLGRHAVVDGAVKAVGVRLALYSAYA